MYNLLIQDFGHKWYLDLGVVSESRAWKSKLIKSDRHQRNDTDGDGIDAMRQKNWAVSRDDTTAISEHQSRTEDH